jgi:hypothetical protein
VHIFLYRILVQFLRTLEMRPSPEAALNAIFKQALGKGVEIGPGPTYNGAYDGVTDLDIHTLLCLCYLDGFQPTEVAQRDSAGTPGPALPSTALRMGEDILKFVLAYQNLMPALALTRGLLALVNFELFHYTVRLMCATNALLQKGVRHGHFEDGHERRSPELYVDFTRDRGGASDEISRACVDRDLEELRVFFEGTG